MADRALYLSHPACLRHEMLAEHPECPQRIHAIEEALATADLFDFMMREEAPAATEAQLRGVHDADYIRSILECRLAEGEHRHLDPDTYMNRHTAHAALHAAGAMVHAVDRVMGGWARAAFCNVRPPGHHAIRGEAMGFCIFNNVAIGARHAVAAHGVKRVAIIDFDAHFGNGTAEAFERDPAVMLCSSYQYPLYPLTGPAPGNERLINVPLPPGCDGATFRRTVGSAWLPALTAFRPQLLLFSAGFDAHHADPLTNLGLHEADFAWVTREVLHATRADCHFRAVSTLEGGYNLPALGRSAAAHVAVLMDAEAPLSREKS